MWSCISFKMVSAPAIRTYAPPDVWCRSSIVLFRRDNFFLLRTCSVKRRIFMHSEPESVTVYKMLNTLPGLREGMHVGVRFRLEHVKTDDSCKIVHTMLKTVVHGWIHFILKFLSMLFLKGHCLQQNNLTI